ncbi:hypothetical protein F4703DRAFT_1717246, partial [Phycomyces blakesleeanus]
RRASYPIQDRIRIYSPATMARQLNKQKHQSKLIVHGVNILNKISLDMNELTQVIPPSEAVSEKWHRAKTLRQAIDYIKSLQMENNGLRTQLGL